MTTTTTTTKKKKTSLQIAEEAQQQDVLEFFLPAVDLENYICQGAVGGGGDGSFAVSREGGPTAQELTNENMLKIVTLQCTDLEVNTLVWKCLGYRFFDKNWTTDQVFPNWKEKYPTPPDFINMQRVYSKQVDEPSLRVNQALVRSIPLAHKQMLKPALKPLGWSGYKMVNLTPNKTRRAQCANWLIYYRDHLFGYTVKELKERRQQQQQAEAAARQPLKEGEEEEFRPPVKEVY